MYIDPAKTRRWFPAVMVAAWLAASPAAHADGGFGNHSVQGQYVLDFDGAFSSSPPPFSGEVLQFRAAMVGIVTFDGSGLASGELTLVFHHPAVPFPIRSRKAVLGSYTVAANGRMLVNVDEFALGDDGQPIGPKGNSLVYECYVVRRQVLANCIAHSLVSFTQGPEPRLLPMTMSGALQRQN